jgi:hypothetical protein
LSKALDLTDVTLVQTAAYPEGLPLEVFDNLRASLVKDRSQFSKDLAVLFYGANRPGAEVSQGVFDQFWLWSMQAGLKNAYESIEAFSESMPRTTTRTSRTPPAFPKPRRVCASSWSRLTPSSSRHPSTTPRCPAGSRTSSIGCRGIGHSRSISGTV